jgi:hypothetical protein
LINISAAVSPHGLQYLSGLTVAGGCVTDQRFKQYYVKILRIFSLKRKRNFKNTVCSRQTGGNSPQEWLICGIKREAVFVISPFLQLGEI